MLSKDNNSDEVTSALSSEIAIPRIVRFWILLPFYIPSLLCSFFILYHLIFDRTLRQALYNHIIIILLLLINCIVQLTSIPWILNYYRLGYVSPPTSSFCLTWVFMDEALYITTTLLFAWATIERHILIFHDRFLNTKCKLLLFHFSPMVIIVVYCICYNTIVILFPPCENTFDYSQEVCGSPLCYYENQVAAMCDVIVNDIIPTTIIIICSVTLLARVVYQKYRMHRLMRWRSHRKMTIQLLSISALYLVIYIPEMLMEFVYRCGVSEDIGADFMMYAKFIKHYGNLLLPFVCAGSIPEIKTKTKKIFLWWRRKGQAVGPETITLSRRVNAGQMKTNAPQ